MALRRSALAPLVALLALVPVACAGPLEESSAVASSDISTAAAAPAASSPGLALSVHTTLGIPEAATVGDPEHYLVVKPQYVTSYDSTKKNARWTSWELTKRWMGSTGRTADFMPDPSLPASLPQASDRDYAHSGYQRGHICPSADRTATVEDNGATFLYTNAVPQTEASNVGTWASLETKERSLAKAGHHLFVIAGSLYENGAHTLGDGVAIPSSMFKIVVVLDGASPTPADVTTTTPVIAVDIPNTTDVSGSYTGYRVKFADLEARTGFHFLSDVSPAVHDALAETTTGP